MKLAQGTDLPYQNLLKIGVACLITSLCPKKVLQQAWAIFVVDLIYLVEVLSVCVKYVTVLTVLSSVGCKAHICEANTLDSWDV